MNIIKDTYMAVQRLKNPSWDIQYELQKLHKESGYGHELALPIISH